MYDGGSSDFIVNGMVWIFWIILIGGGILGYLGRTDENGGTRPLTAPPIIQELREGKVTVGYIDDPQESIDVAIEVEDETVKLKKEIELLKLRKQLNELKEEASINPQQTSLVNDCVAALVGLGHKKSEARSKANKYFVKNPDTKTVDEFITGVFQNEN